MHLQLFIFLNPKLNKIEEIRLCLCLFPLIVDAVDFGVKLLYFEDADLVLVLLIVEKNILIVEVEAELGFNVMVVGEGGQGIIGSGNILLNAVESGGFVDVLFFHNLYIRYYKLKLKL